jgi:hypothetical protein
MSEKGLGASTQGLDGVNETKLEQQDSQFQQSVFAQASSSQASFSGGQQVEVASTTFVLPDFAQTNTSGVGASPEGLLSPTQA